MSAKSKPVVMNGNDDDTNHPIEVVYAPAYCQFSVVQRDLRTLSRNQRVLYDKLDVIEQLLRSFPH